jgi:hypothetical protein
VAGASLPQYTGDVKNVWSYTFTALHGFFILDRFVTESFVSFELREGTGKKRNLY